MDKMPDEVWVIGSPSTGRLYGHLYKGKGRSLYRRADLPKEVDLGALRLDKMILCNDMQLHYKQGWHDCLDHLVALGVIKDKGV